MNNTAELRKARPIQSVTVIGAGGLGRAFALRCVQAGFAVVLEDVLSSKLRAAADVLAAESPDLQARLRLATSVEDAVREADVVIDFVPDELESKLEIFSLVDRMAPPRTLLCTPTELSITDLASCTYRADRCVALKPFGTSLGASVVLVRGEMSADACVHDVAAWLEALGSVVRVEEDLQRGLLLQR